MALADLHRCVQHPSRTVILTLLLEDSRIWTFTEVRDRTGLTDGNLNRHLKVLVDVGWVKSHRSGRGRGSTTTLGITSEGLLGLESLRAWCEEVIAVLAEGGVGGARSRSPTATSGMKSDVGVVDDRSRAWVG